MVLMVVGDGVGVVSDVGGVADILTASLSIRWSGKHRPLPDEPNLTCRSYVYGREGGGRLHR